MSNLFMAIMNSTAIFLASVSLILCLCCKNNRSVSHGVYRAAARGSSSAATGDQKLSKSNATTRRVESNATKTSSAMSSMSTMAAQKLQAKLSPKKECLPPKGIQNNERSRTTANKFQLDVNERKEERTQQSEEADLKVEKTSSVTKSAKNKNTFRKIQKTQSTERNNAQSKGSCDADKAKILPVDGKIGIYTKMNKNPQTIEQCQFVAAEMTPTRTSSANAENFLEIQKTQSIEEHVAMPVRGLINYGKHIEEATQHSINERKTTNHAELKEKLRSAEKVASRTKQQGSAEKITTKTKIKGSAEKIGFKTKHGGSAERIATETKSRESIGRVGSKAKSRDSAERVGSRAKSRDSAERVGSKARSRDSAEKIGSKPKSRGSAEKIGSKSKSRGSAEKIGPKAKSRGSKEKIEVKKKSGSQRGSAEKILTKAKRVNSLEKIGIKAKQSGSAEKVSVKKKLDVSATKVASKTKLGGSAEKVGIKLKPGGSAEKVGAKTKSGGSAEKIGTKTKAGDSGEKVATKATRGGSTEKLGATTKPGKGDKIGAKPRRIGTREKIVAKNRSGSSREDRIATKERRKGSAEKKANIKPEPENKKSATKVRAKRTGSKERQKKTVSAGGEKLASKLKQRMENIVMKANDGILNLLKHNEEKRGLDEKAKETKEVAATKAKSSGSDEKIHSKTLSSSDRIDEEKFADHKDFQAQLRKTQEADEDKVLDGGAYYSDKGQDDTSADAPSLQINSDPPSKETES